MSMRDNDEAFAAMVWVALAALVGWVLVYFIMRG
jgi:hypothetical protein